MNILKKFAMNFLNNYLSPKRRAERLKRKGIIKIGNDCEFYGNINFGSEPYLISIGDKVRITDGVKFVTHDGGMWVLRNMGIAKNADKFGKIIIGNNVHIGSNTIIMPGVTIGNNVIIGVNAVVTKDIPSNSVAVGVPARRIKSIEEYFSKNQNDIDYIKNMNASEKKDYLLKKFKI